MKKLLKAFSLITILIPLAACSSRPTSTTLTFDANGGYFGSDSNNKTLSLTGKINEVIDASLYGTPVHEDSDKYIFEGWVEKDSSTLLPSTLRYPYVNTTIYATWAEKVTITYNTGKADYEHDPEVGYAGRTITLWEPEIEEGDPFVFNGWYLDDQFNEAYYLNQFPNEDTTLYAKFTEFPIITLNYSATKVDTYQAKAGTKITKNFDAVEVPPGSTFEGWFYNVTEGDGSIREVQFFFDYMPNESLTLYPKFEEDISVTISFDLGANHTGTIPSITGEPGERIDYDDRPDLDEIELGNYQLLGWYYTDSETGQEVKFEFDVYPTSNLTLTAKWSAYPILSFDCTGYTGLSYEPIVAMAGSILPPLPVPSYEHKEFLYWAVKVNGAQGDEYVIFNSSYMPEENLTLYPIFQDQRKITIVYTYDEVELTDLEFTTEFYLQTSRDSITSTWWNEHIQIPNGYVQRGIYDKIYKADDDTVNEYHLPQSPDTDITYYIDLAQVVTLNIFCPTDPMWYVSNTVPTFERKATIQGGEGMALDVSTIYESIAKTGFRLEGFYESYEADADDFDYYTPNTLSTYPNVGADGILEFNIYVKYFQN